MKVHSSAIVDPAAELGVGVQVGAFSIIEKDVVLGDYTWVGPHVVIRSHTTIGEHNKIFQFCSIGEQPQHHDYAGEPTKLQIGARNIIREYCTLNRGTAAGHGITRVGDDNFIMAYVHIAHDCALGNHTVLANGSSLAGHVAVDDYAIIGGFSLVHQFCKIGAHCITGIGTVCLQDVPPYIVASGNLAKPFGINVKGLRRRNYSEDTIKLLKKAYKLIYRNHLDIKTAIATIEDMNCDDPDLAILRDFLSCSQRGIIR